MAVMRDIADFYRLVFAHAPAAPIPEVEVALREAARTMCRRLKLWREDETFVIADPADEAIYSSQDARIHAVEAPRLDGRLIEVLTPLELDERHPGWQDHDAGTTIALTQLQPNQITLYPKSTGTLKARLVLVPSLDAYALPEFLLTDYADILEEGATGLLLAKATNPEYANPGLGSGLLAKFNAEIDTRSAQTARLQLRNPRRARTRFF